MKGGYLLFLSLGYVTGAFMGLKPFYYVQYHWPSNWNPSVRQYKSMWHPGDTDDDFEIDRDNVDRQRKEYYDHLLVKISE